MTLTEFLAHVLDYIGAPASDTNLFVLGALARSEGVGLQAWNPLDTEQREPGSSDFNSAGVQVYPSPAEGVIASGETLLNGYYPALVDALRSSRPASFFADGAVAANLRTWQGGSNIAVATIYAGDVAAVRRWTDSVQRAGDDAPTPRGDDDMPDPKAIRTINVITRFIAGDPAAVATAPANLNWDDAHAAALGEGGEEYLIEGIVNGTDPAVDPQLHRGLVILNTLAQGQIPTELVPAIKALLAAGG